MEWKTKLREIIDKYPKFNSFLSFRNREWISEISEVKAKILNHRLQKPANTPLEVTIEDAIGYIGKEEKGASDIFGQEEVIPFRNDENMDYEEWQKEEKERFSD